MTLFHNLGISDPQGSAEPNNKDACFLLQVNTQGYKYELPFCLPLSLLTETRVSGQESSQGSTHCGFTQPMRLFLPYRNYRLWESLISERLV